MSSIENAKRAMDWMHPNQRQSCGNCAHVKVEASSRNNIIAIFRCARGGFLTPRHAICGEYEPAVLTGSAPT